MICAKDGSPMRVVTQAPDFRVWACSEACHHVREGVAPPPAVDAAHTLNPAKLARTVFTKEPWMCGNGQCKRPRHADYKQCLPCLLIRRAAQKRYEERHGLVAAR
jgi:hypothetical protein